MSRWQESKFLLLCSDLFYKKRFEELLSTMDSAALDVGSNNSMHIFYRAEALLALGSADKAVDLATGLFDSFDDPDSRALACTVLVHAGKNELARPRLIALLHDPRLPADNRKGYEMMLAKLPSE